MFFFLVKIVFKNPVDMVFCVCNLIYEFADSRFKMLSWNGILAFYYQNYMVLSMFGWISMKDLRFGSGYSAAEKFSSIFGVILLIFSFVFPIILSIVILRNYKPFYNEEKFE